MLCATLNFNNNKRWIYELNLNIKDNKHGYKNATNIFKTLLQLIFENTINIEIWNAFYINISLRF